MGDLTVEQARLVHRTATILCLAIIILGLSPSPRIRYLRAKEELRELESVGPAIAAAIAERRHNPLRDGNKDVRSQLSALIAQLLREKGYDARSLEDSDETEMLDCSRRSLPVPARVSEWVQFVRSADLYRALDVADLSGVRGQLGAIPEATAVWERFACTPYVDHASCDSNSDPPTLRLVLGFVGRMDDSSAAAASRDLEEGRIPEQQELPQREIFVALSPSEPVPARDLIAPEAAATRLNDLASVALLGSEIADRDIAAAIQVLDDRARTRAQEVSVLGLSVSWFFLEYSPFVVLALMTALWLMVASMDARSLRRMPWELAYGSLPGIAIRWIGLAILPLWACLSGTVGAVREDMEAYPESAIQLGVNLQWVGVGCAAVTVYFAIRTAWRLQRLVDSGNRTRLTHPSGVWFRMRRRRV